MPIKACVLMYRHYLMWRPLRISRQPSRTCEIGGNLAATGEFGARAASIHLVACNHRGLHGFLASDPRWIGFCHGRLSLEGEGEMRERLLALYWGITGL